MNYAPDKLEGITFCKSILNGYNRNQVDAALSKIIEDYNQNIDEINELKSKNAELNEAIKRYKTVEEAMQHCLLLAQNASDEMKTSASEKAQSIMEAAEQTSQKMISDASQKVNKLNFAYEEMKAKVFTFRTRSEALLGAQLDVLKQLSDDSTTST
jgi:DivIVA domain